MFSFRAIWHDKEFFPTSWQLDRTEGPCRVRCRLQRCHLDIDEKFIMPEYQKTRKKLYNISQNFSRFQLQFQLSVIPFITFYTLQSPNMSLCRISLMNPLENLPRGMFTIFSIPRIQFGELHNVLFKVTLHNSSCYFCICIYYVLLF